MTSSAILDQHGRPFTGESKTASRRDVNASYDLSKTTAHNRKHWAAADSLAARAAMTPAIRAIVRKRSRYEFDNNSWYSGILRTAANHIVGSGPRLQVLTDHADGNNRLERAWRKASRQIMRMSRVLRKVECEAPVTSVRRTESSGGFIMRTRVCPACQHKKRTFERVVSGEKSQTEAR